MAQNLPGGLNRPTQISEMNPARFQVLKDICIRIYMFFNEVFSSCFLKMR